MESLKILAAHNQSLADWSTILVFVGLLGEIVITFAYTKDKPRSEIILSVLVGALIAVGVFGEYRYGSRAAHANAELQNWSDQAVAGLNKKAADAYLLAKGFESQIASANERAAKAETTAEDERMARVQLGSKVAWRTLSKVDQRKLVSSLSIFSGELAQCAFLSGDTEAFSFSSEIARVLRASKWRVIPPNPYVLMLRETSLPTTASPIESIEFGVEISATADVRAVAAADSLMQELNCLGFDAHFSAKAEPPQQSRIWVTVQHRPLGPQGQAKVRAEKKAREQPNLK